MRIMYNDFTYLNYEIFLETLAADYEFIPFSRAKYTKEKLERKVLLRHDIDQSLIKAAKMSDIESKMGISATYFLFLKSPFYNIFSNDNEKYINRIIENNHCIGLHFDYSISWHQTLAQIPFQITQEAEFIQNYFSIKVDAISFHRPFNINFLNKLELSSFPNAYEKIFIENFKYFSDSRGCWRYGHPFDSQEYTEKKNLHLLVHPIWWNESQMSPLQTLNNFKKQYNRRFIKSLYTELKSFWNTLEKEKQEKKNKLIPLEKEIEKEKQVEKEGQL